MSQRKKNEAPDRAIRSVVVCETRSVGQGYRHYERFSLRLTDNAGRSCTLDRDLLRCGQVVEVLAIDPVREEIVLTRQFRLGAFLAIGERETVEIVAGQVDRDEDAAQAARRECLEEIGIEAMHVIPVLQLTPAPAFSDELMTLFLACVDARKAPLRAGASHEQEKIAVVRYKIDDAIGLIDGKSVHSAPTLIALQWLSRNRGLIATLLE
jgi:ADP-ribose pyrophosphatase